MVLKPQPPSDFLNAHHRHWTDAELLYSQDRRANADHLYGLSAECGVRTEGDPRSASVGERGPARGS